MKEATYVAISTQKGGAGKTTLTVLVASYLHYKGKCKAQKECAGCHEKTGIYFAETV